MRLIIKNSFFETLSTVSDSAKLKAFDFIEKIARINDLSEVDSEPLLGFPYYHKISIEKYNLCIYVSKDKEIEILGIVEKGKEFRYLT